ncbi:MULTISPECIES: TetR/AcrR family transcriptional regulator [unclassified Gordonia (in: high G+C Gram-positive bacteria)]|uniref:TetR/AcrR family transcriptional regulator n=1 Tax=unclassified Gordonia (in: high G+C Gram-positive bacteria) TaxID=2657482 RepID=UPI001F0E9526|nr:TetR/AcrR family transcriptional regulator [Gordonia sp. ABSL49_1]MCH5641345.1 TetR/AcrR family transcriptional regulator [Gordonia sp. ABSL49_1]
MRSKLESERTFADQARRRQIVACAIDLIAEVGYPQASLAKIAERAGIAKSVVLYHFKNKDEIVEGVVASVFEASVAIIAPRVLAATTPPERLIAYIESNGEFLDRHRREAVALHEVSLGYRDASGRRFDQAVVADVEEHGIPSEFAILDPLVILQKGLTSGEFASDADPLTLKNILRASLDGAVSELSRDADYDVIAHCAAVRNLFVNALGAQS